MYSLWFVQWDFTRRDHPGNFGRVFGSGLVNTCGVEIIFEEDAYEENEEKQMEDLKQALPKF